MNASAGQVAAIDPNERGLKLMLRLFGRARWRSSYIVGLLLVAGAVEGIGVVALLPVISTFSQNTSEAGFLSGLVVKLIGLLGGSGDLGEILVVIALVFWLKAALSIYAKTLAGYASTRFATACRAALIDGLMQVRWAYFTKQPLGNLSNAVTTEATRAGAAYSSMFEVFSLTLQVAIYGAIAIAISPLVTLVSVLTAGGLIVLFRLPLGITRRAGARQQVSFKRLIGQLVDNLQAIKPLKAMALELRIGPMLTRETEVLNRAHQQVVFSKALVQYLAEPILVTLIGVGLLTLTAFGMGLAEVLFIAVVFYRGVGRVSQLQSAYQSFVGNESFVGAISDHLNQLRQQRELKTGRKTPVLRRGITLRKVWFAYPGVPVLQDVDAFIPIGKLTTIYGPSGSGKTTLIDLAIGLIKLDAGAILIDDVSIDEIDIDLWRQMIGYVPQELTLFNDTILANVTMKDPNLSESDATEALRAAGALGFVTELPDGLQTLVGERGAQLSGGQRQRISLARALARKPALLVLDEPTASLDPATERAICDTLLGLRNKTTILVITHRHTLVDVADVVLPLLEGRIASLADEMPVPRAF